MKITRNQLRRLILKEMRQMNRRQLSEDLSAGGIAKLHKYMINKQMKYSVVGAMAVMAAIGDELIDLVTEDKLDVAAKKFMAAYKAL